MPQTENKWKARLSLPYLLKLASNRSAIWLRSSAYVIISLIYRALGLLLVPITVAALTAEEFSRYGLMTSVIVLLTAVLSLNIHLAPGRLFFDYDSRLEQSTLLSTSFLASTGLTAFGFLMLITVLQLGNIADPISLGSIEIQALLFLATISTVWFQFAITVVRIRANVQHYGILFMLQRIALIGGFVGLNSAMADSFRALILSYSGSMFISGVIGIRYCRSNLGITYLDREMFWSALKFSAPVMVHSLAIWAVTSSGRWIGALYISLEELAPYMLVTFFYGIVSMLPRALFEARIPDIGFTFAKQDYSAGKQIVSITVRISVLIVVVIYASTFLLLYGLGIRLPDEYMPTPLLIVVASAANVFDAIYLGGIQLLTAIKHTQTQAYVTIVSGVITVAVSFFLVSAYKDLGLVIAFAAGMLIQAIGANIVAQRRVASFRQI